MHPQPKKGRSPNPGPPGENREKGERSGFAPLRPNFIPWDRLPRLVFRFGLATLVFAEERRRPAKRFGGVT